MKNRILKSLLIVLAILSISSCRNFILNQTGSEITVEIPVFTEIPSNASPIMSKALEVNDSNKDISYSVFYHWYAPIVSNFKKATISEAESMSDIEILGKNVNIKFSEEDGKYIYRGISDDNNTFYSKVTYDPSTSTFSYIQVLNAELKFDGGDRSRIDVIAGNNIKVEDDGTIQGTVRHYFIQKDKDGISLSDFNIGDGEYFSGSAGSGTIFKGFSRNTTKLDSSESAVLLGFLNTPLQGIDDFENAANEIQTIGDAYYEPLDPDSYDGMIWYDKKSNGIFSKGDGSANNPIFSSFEEAQEFATKYSDSEWVLSDPEDVNYN